jgi:ribosomal protein S18 acetylase RimI-like enzyme
MTDARSNVPQEHNTVTSTDKKEGATDDKKKESIHIVRLEEKHLPQLVNVFNDSFGSKRCCCLLFSTKESLGQLQSRYSSTPEAKRQLGFVAVDGDNEHDIVLGFAQMTRYGLPVYPEGFHDLKRNEIYLEIMGVSEDARGRGVGTQLLDKCVETAKLSAASSHTNVTLTLEVLRGNRAIGLYERVGFHTVYSNPIDDCCGAAMVFFFLGRPYGLCNPGWGAISMEMQVMDRE